MKIIVDTMGSDNGCAEMTRGALDAAREYGIEVTLVGDESIMSPVVQEYGDVKERVKLVNIPKAISMSDDSSSVKGENVLRRAVEMLCRGRGRRFVTAGSIGAAITPPPSM